LNLSPQAVKKACEELIERLKIIKDEFPNADWSQTIDEAFKLNVALSASYMYKAPDLKDYDIWAASCAEVEVDLLTGNFQVKRVDILEDVGESISPGIDVGQIEGGFMMGLGYWLTESLVFNLNNGELTSNRTWTYKPPGAKDIPIDFRVNFLRNSSNPFGVLRSKGDKVQVIMQFKCKYRSLQPLENPQRRWLSL
jgi:xanthine dehydrogenase/oxidase